MAGVGPLPDDTADFGDYVKNWDGETDLEELVGPCYKYGINLLSRLSWRSTCYNLPLDWRITN